MQGRKVSKENFWQKNGKAQVCCIEKWYGITELQNFEQLEDAIFYAQLFNLEVVPKMVFSTENSSGSTRKTNILFFTFVDCKLFQINKF